jgi:hypothetical protein
VPSPPTDRRLADFLVIGAVKAATTSIAAYLDSHPGIFVPARKELAFFTYEYNWLRGRDWYESCFEGSEPGQLRGDVSPHYAWWPSYEGVPERAAAVVPDARIIYLVRDPVERMASMFRQASGFGGERRSFARAVLETSDYLDTSRYHTQLQRWLNCFPEEQVLVVATEALRTDPAAVMTAVFSFLDVDTGWRPPELDLQHNRTPDELRAVPVELPGVHRELIRDLLTPEVEALRAFLPSPFDGWGLTT